MSVDEYVGASLCALRLEAGYSRPALASKLDMTRDELAAIETGTVRPCSSTSQTLSMLLNVSISDLFAEYFEFVDHARPTTKHAPLQHGTDNIIHLANMRR